MTDRTRRPEIKNNSSPEPSPEPDMPVNFSSSEASVAQAPVFHTSGSAPAPQGVAGLSSLSSTGRVQPPIPTRVGVGDAPLDDSTEYDDLPQAFKEAYDALMAINGQDAYSAEARAVGKLNADEYLALPTGFTWPEVPASEVGGTSMLGAFDLQSLAAIYVLNKLRAPAEANPVIYGLLRMEAVKMGWLKAQKEVAFVTPPPGFLRVFLSDMSTVVSQIELLRTAAFVVPLCAEVVFRTYGHHYLSGQEGDYINRYRTLLKSCLVPDVHNLLPPSVMYHHALHWVSPSRVREVVTAQLNRPRLPEAIAIRYDAAPAGTAIITTTAAVLKAMEASGLLPDIRSLRLIEVDSVFSLNREIRNNPPAFHRTCFAYNMPPLPEDVRQRLETCKAACVSFAPLTQAFIEAIFKDAALGKAKALEKHAFENPVLRTRARNFFRDLGKEEATSLASLFPTTSR
jgi:hypothetical protein